MATTTDAIEAPVPAIVRRLWTRKEYERMVELGILDENDRAELIAGEIVLKMTQKSPHATGVSLGEDALRAVARTGFYVRAQLPIALDPDSEPEPDLAIVSGSARTYRNEHPTSAVLVVEVSDPTLAFDRAWKHGLYARAGIQEYWIVHLVAGVLEVYRDPAPDPAATLGYGYRMRLTLGPEESVSIAAFPSATIAVRDLLP
jgi:Uma2 family endonuclease